MEKKDNKKKSDIKIEDEIIVLKGEYKRTRGLVKQIDVKQGVNVYTVSLIAPGTGPLSGPYVLGVKKEFLREQIDRIPATRRWIKPEAIIPTQKEEQLDTIEDTIKEATTEIVESSNSVEELAPTTPKKRGRSKKVKEESKKEETKGVEQEMNKDELVFDEKVSAAANKLKSEYTFEEVKQIVRCLTLEISAYISEKELLEEKFGFKKGN